MKEVMAKLMVRDFITSGLFVYGHYRNIYSLEMAVIVYIWLWPPFSVLAFGWLPAARRGRILSEVAGKSGLYSSNLFFRSYVVFRITAFCILLLMFQWYVTGMIYLLSLWLMDGYIKKQIVKSGNLCQETA